MLVHSGRREHLLLHDYLSRLPARPGRGLRDQRGPADDERPGARAARPADQAPLLAEAVEALGSGRDRRLVVDLPSGLTARVHCRPELQRGRRRRRGAAGAAASPTSGPAERARRRACHARPCPPRSGPGTAWTKCGQAVDRHFQAREWLILEGEPGVGKTTLARATHQNRTPAGHLRVLDADDYGPQWIARGRPSELEDGDGGTLVLTHVDRLPAAGVAGARRRARAPPRVHRRRPAVGGRDRDPRPARDGDADLAALLSCFPRTVEVPPLRHHIEDVAELVPHLLARLARGST